MKRPRLSRRRLQVIAAALEQLIHDASHNDRLRVVLSRKARRDARAALTWALAQLERRSRKPDLFTTAEGDSQA